MNFSKKQKDYIIHALEHCEVLTGGRSSGKILELIKQQNKEIERLNNIINELEKYLDNLHWFRLGKKEENGNMEYFYASISNFYEDTKSILKGSDKE